MSFQSRQDARDLQDAKKSAQEYAQAYAKDGLGVDEIIPKLRTRLVIPETDARDAATEAVKGFIKMEPIQIAAVAAPNVQPEMTPAFVAAVLAPQVPVNNAPGVDVTVTKVAVVSDDNKTAAAGTVPAVVQAKVETQTTEEDLVESIQAWNQSIQDGLAEFNKAVPTTTEKMMAVLKESLRVFPPETPISDGRLAEMIRVYAPNADQAKTKTTNTAYPAVLRPLAEGQAWFENELWFSKRCRECGKFHNELCCGNKTIQVSVTRADGTLTAYGRQVVGLDPIKPRATPKTQEQITASWIQNPWWQQFRSVGELETGGINMFIENFLPQGVTIISGLPKEGKGWLSLAIAKALTTGQPLFGKPGFEVPEIIPVLYLAAEGSDRALEHRCSKFGITKDKNLFICRTLSQGVMLGLNSPDLESLVKAMKPVIILETLRRFNDAEDENDSGENNKLAQALFRLISMGARSIVCQHHSRKDLNKSNPTKEQAVRGSGDGLAMVDAIWLVMQDDRTYRGGSGPTEIDVVGWGRDFSCQPMRLALTERAPKGVTLGLWGPPGSGLISCLDRGGLKWVDKSKPVPGPDPVDLKQTAEQLVAENPDITIRELAKRTGYSKREAQKVLKQLGHLRPHGGKRP